MCYNCIKTVNTVITTNPIHKSEVYPMIKLDYKSSGPLHQQIENGLRELIISGAVSADEQLPSVRELAVSLTVNPNTVQRAYKQLEADGYIYSIQGKGNFVAPVSCKKDTTQMANIGIMYATISASVKELIYLGEDKTNIIKFVEKIFERQEELQ